MKLNFSHPSKVFHNLHISGSTKIRIWNIGDEWHFVIERNNGILRFSSSAQVIFILNYWCRNIVWSLALSHVAKNKFIVLRTKSVRKASREKKSAMIIKLFTSTIKIKNAHIFHSRISLMSVDVAKSLLRTVSTCEERFQLLVSAMKLLTTTKSLDSCEFHLTTESQLFFCEFLYKQISHIFCHPFYETSSYVHEANDMNETDQRTEKIWQMKKRSVNKIKTRLKKLQTLKVYF